MVLEMTYPQLERAVNPTHDIRLFSGRSNPKLAQEINKAIDKDAETHGEEDTLKMIEKMHQEFVAKK